MSSQTRVDKWLWAVRIFKTRTIASNACKTGRIKINDKTLKASYLVKEGDQIRVRKEGFNLDFLVVKIISKRVSFPLAQECYQSLTPQEELNKYKEWFIGKARPEMREKGTGRPTKKERREIEHFKEEFFDFSD